MGNIENEENRSETSINMLPDYDSFMEAKKLLLEDESRYKEPIVIEKVKYYQSKDYYIWSLLNSICCCCVFGICALVNSIKARERFRIGENESADKFSKRAKLINIISSCMGIAFWVLIVALFIFLIMLPFKLLAHFAGNPMNHHELTNVLTGIESISK